KPRQVQLVLLANMLFIRCFKVNFNPRTEGIISMDAGDNNAQINYKFDGQKVWFELVSSSRKTLLVNGQDVASGRSAELEMSLYEFNQMCGAIKRQSIRFLVDAFEGIDGVEEYFNVLHFSEGFFEEWPLN
ncbi:hypothetical protein, partial [Loktanella sp. D2R18]|uniref:hypothetical protein n=2 Tax=Rhodobacterales TaxID=204455 RepID=UPI001C69271D